MLEILDSENDELDLTTEVVCLTDTPDADHPRLCYPLVYLGDGVKDLDGTGGNFTVRATFGARFGIAETFAVPAGDLQMALAGKPFVVPPATEVTLRVLSPNAADIDVAVTAYLMAFTPQVDVGSVAGQALSGQVGPNFQTLFNNSGVATSRGLDSLPASIIHVVSR